MKDKILPELNGKMVEFIERQPDGRVLVCFTDRSELWIDNGVPKLRVNLP